MDLPLESNAKRNCKAKTIHCGPRKDIYGGTSFHLSTMTPINIVFHRFTQTLH